MERGVRKICNREMGFNRDDGQKKGSQEPERGEREEKVVNIGCCHNLRVISFQLWESAGVGGSIRRTSLLSPGSGAGAPSLPGYYTGTTDFLKTQLSRIRMNAGRRAASESNIGKCMGNINPS
jgi:hypothetical protein